jgi:hypothetical protein
MTYKTNIKFKIGMLNNNQNKLIKIYIYSFKVQLHKNRYNNNINTVIIS